MASRINVVVAGDYLGRPIVAEAGGQPVLLADAGNKIYLTSETVAQKELVSSEQSRSSGSAAKRALVGRAVLGRKGMVAGAATARRVTSYQISLTFKDGKRSLVEVDENLYKMIVKSTF